MSFSRIVFAISLALATVAGFAHQNPTVVVVGAGFAGLTTAYRLQQKGMDVHVYEARNRVGGRVFSAKIGDRIFELGGQNLTDGGEAANIHRLMDEFGLESTGFQTKFGFFYFDNQTLIPGHLLQTQEFDPETLKSKLAEISMNSRNMRDVLDQLFQKEDPFYKSLSVRLASFEGATIDKLSSLYTNTLYYMLLGGICSVHQTSDQEENNLHMVSIRGGNMLLLEKMAETLKERVHLNMPLVSVSKGQDGAYELLFKNGETVSADILVLTMPCSVYDDIGFEESLIPADRLESIRKVQYGTNAKILVPFPEPLSKRITLINDRIVGYFDEKCTLLTLYFTGDAGKFSEESILDAYRQERPMLEFGFKELCPPLSTPMIAQDGSFVSYDGPVGHSWPNDPYVKGSYSYIAEGQETILTSMQEENGEKVRSLFAPIDGTLFFAGEHATILMDVPGTMEAACESGERTARMIQNIYEQKAK